MLGIVLIALMCGCIVPTSVRGYNTGPSDPNTAWNEYGPNLSTLWIRAYSGYSAEVVAMTGGTCDMIDTSILPPLPGGFSYSKDTILGVYGVDWNNAFYPFNITDYSKAVSEILQIDKVNFVSGLFGNNAVPVYSPIPGEIPVNSNWDWYNPNTANIYTGGYTGALTYLLDFIVLSQAPLAQDSAPGITGVPGGYLPWTWNFTAPYPKDPMGNSYNPLLTGGLAGGEGYGYMGNGANYGLQMLLPTATPGGEDPWAGYIGAEVQTMLGADFTSWYLNVAVPANLPIVTIFKADVAAAGGNPNTAVPYISVQNILGTMSTFTPAIFYNYCYEMYASYYSYGFTPDSMLKNYLSSNSPQAYDWSVVLKDDTCFIDPAYDGLETLMENATTQGNSAISPLLQPGTAVYYCWEAQMELMGGLGGPYGPPCFPYWTFTQYQLINSYDSNAIDENGTGFDNWYTYLDMYDTANSPFYSMNAAVQGMSNGALSGCNPLSSYTVYDDFVWKEIYDTLAISNPYNLSQLVPYIATSWYVGTWTNTGNGTWLKPQTCSDITINMRSDVEWQDVPGPENRAPYTLDNGPELNGPLTNRFMTPMDVAFTYAYAMMGVGFTTFYTMEPWCMQIDHIVLSKYWESAWKAANPLGPTGYPWANEPYIEGIMGTTPSTLAWPTWQFVTPPTDAYYNTSLFEKQLVQFSPTLGPFQIQIYSSLLIPWLIAYRALGNIILPMDIFSHIAEGAWPTTDIQGNPWTTVDVTTMDLEPWSFSGRGGADLEYGSGPFILVDDPLDMPATTFRLDAYNASLTYGPGLVFPGAPTIRTDHGFFLQGPVSEATTAEAQAATAVYGGDVNAPYEVCYEPGANTTSPSGIPEAAFKATVWLENWATSAERVSVTFNLWFEYWDPVAVAWRSLRGPNAITVSPVTLPAAILNPSYLGGIQPSVTPVTGDPILCPMVDSSTGLTVSPRWVIPSLTGVGTILPGPRLRLRYVGAGAQFYFGCPNWPQQPVYFIANPGNYYTNFPYELIYLNATQGDITGCTTTSAPYQGADGLVNILDYSLIVANWGKYVSVTTDPNSDVARCDIISNGGPINILDIGLCAARWGLAYSWNPYQGIPMPGMPPAFYAPPPGWT